MFVSFSILDLGYLISEGTFSSGDSEMPEWDTEMRDLDYQ